MYLSIIQSQCILFMFCINCFFYLFPLLSLPSACDCNDQGSADMQCDRRTGQCVCLTGISGYKCDRCDRGTTGELPNCKPCGECFDNWDRVIRDLRGIVPPQILNMQFILYIMSIYKLMKDWSFEKRLANFCFTKFWYIMSFSKQRSNPVFGQWGSEDQGYRSRKGIWEGVCWNGEQHPGNPRHHPQCKCVL